MDQIIDCYRLPVYYWVGGGHRYHFDRVDRWMDQGISLPRWTEQRGQTPKKDDTEPDELSSALIPKWPVKEDRFCSIICSHSSYYSFFRLFPLPIRFGGNWAHYILFRWVGDVLYTIQINDIASLISLLTEEELSQGQANKSGIRSVIRSLNKVCTSQFWLSLSLLSLMVFATNVPRSSTYTWQVSILEWKRGGA